MKRLEAPKDPEAVGLAVVALRHYVAPGPNPTKFETDMERRLTTLKLSKTVATRMVKNFDAIRPSVRQHYLGKLGVTGAAPPQRVATRDLNAVTTSHVAVPLTLRHRFQIPRPGQAPAPGPAVLAPLDYTITYEGLHCVDETGLDWLGSDEPYVVTSAVHFTPRGANVLRTERHPFAGDGTNQYGGVDSGDTRIGPRAATWNGVVADVALGMSLTTVVFEHDQGDPNKYRDEVDAAVKLAVAIAGYLYPPAKAILALVVASGLLTDFFNWLLGTGDDEIGTHTVVLEFDDLETYARSAVQTYRRGSTNTGLQYHFLADVNDTDYVVAYQVQRNPRAPLFPQGPVE